ncbi:hypothetical protein IL306_005363 [Fusarium sp. DS 682]|nr:hypothetical protein IL306_005363 [Fusarium sp. DS 682]
MSLSCSCNRSKFSAPPGLDSLDGTVLGGITTSDLIKGSVRTYMKNGKKNSADSLDPSSGDLDAEDLDVDITTPALVLAPSTHATSPPGKKECEESSFKDETSDKSPLVKDYGSTKWTTQVVGNNQRKIAAAGTCAFGVEAIKVDGNDVIGIINATVEEYSKNGKVGAKSEFALQW